MSPYYDPTTNLDAQAQKKENKLVNLALTKMPFPHISGLKLQEDIQLGSLVLNKIDPDTGVVWVATKLDGWWNLPDSEFPDVARGWGDGSYDADGRYTSRVMTLEGSFLTQSPDQAIAARKKLVEAINSVYSPKDLIVKEYTLGVGGAKVNEYKVASVRISGRPQIEDRSARGRTDFSIGLKAADPIKYEYYNSPSTGNYRTVTLTRNTNVTVTNTGNVRVPVIFSITGGDIAGGEILNTANGNTQTISGVYMETADTRLEIDTYNRNIVAIDASDVARVGRKYADSYVDWIYLEPGSNVLKFSSTDATAVCVMYYKSGWLA
jgi:hypothetical protein